jgi:hypothetical protein
VAGESTGASESSEGRAQPIPASLPAVGARNALGDDPAQNFNSDLASIDFGDILGAPLTAAISAQAQAAMVTANFISSVGFSKSSASAGGQSSGPLQVQNIDFAYKRSTVDPKTGVVTQVDESLSVPLLSILPIPYLRIQQLSVSLSVKLNAVTKADSSSSVTSTTNTGTSGGFFSFFDPVKVDCTVVTKNDSSNSQQITEDYDLEVKMLAVQDSMPAGLAKVLGILESLIQPTSAGDAPAPPPP